MSTPNPKDPAVVEISDVSPIVKSESENNWQHYGEGEGLKVCSEGDVESVKSEQSLSESIRIESVSIEDSLVYYLFISLTFAFKMKLEFSFGNFHWEFFYRVVMEIRLEVLLFVPFSK